MTKGQLIKFEWIVEDPFYSPEYDQDVIVTDESEIVSVRYGDVLGMVDEHNIDDLYRDWFEFTSQDWDTDNSAPVPD